MGCCYVACLIAPSQMIQAKHTEGNVFLLTPYNSLFALEYTTSLYTIICMPKMSEIWHE